MEVSSFPELMLRLREGDQRAASQIFNEYSLRLAELAKSRLQGALGAKVDADDVLQSAFRSFFVRHRDGQFEVDSWDSLWSLLAVITLRKCGKQVDHYRAACRNLKREACQGDDDTLASFEAIARDPTPDESASLLETVETILRELSPRDRQIVERTLAGEAVEEIGDQVACSERTVERVRARLQTRLEAMLEN